MASRTIKISEENYRRLLNIATELQRKRQERVTFDDALHIMEAGNISKRKGKLSDLAGAWKDMDDKEWNKIKKDIDKGWKKWEIPSV